MRRLLRFSVGFGAAILLPSGVLLWRWESSALRCSAGGNICKLLRSFSLGWVRGFSGAGSIMTSTCLP